MEIEALYFSHGPALLAYLRRSFGGQAEDLLQETFVRALAQRERCLSARSPRAFLFGIARNAGLAACRGKKMEAALERGLVVAEEASGKDLAGIAEMREAVAGLPLHLRETLELRLREEMSYEEIAQVLEVPVGTVRSRLHGAMKLLREMLNEESS